jgi:putative hemolysin
VARLDGSPTSVGAHRSLRQGVAEANFGFYSVREFQVGPLIARPPRRRFLELGRSCVAPGYRGKRTIELLWRGIWALCDAARRRRRVRLRELSGR